MFPSVVKDVASNTGIQSYCFRGFKTLREVLPRLKACGAATVELSGVHGRFTDPADAERMVSECREAGVRIAGIGVERMTGDVARERALGEFMRLAGARVMSVDFLPSATPEVWRSAERMADEYELRLAIHNHGGRHWLGNAQMLEQVFASTSPRIGLCLDTAWALDAHEDPVAMAEKFGARLYGLHIKDFVFDRTGKPSDVIIGNGNLDLPRLLSVIEANPRTESVVIEYEGDIEDPVPALTRCVQKLHESAR